MQGCKGRKVFFIKYSDFAFVATYSLVSPEIIRACFLTLCPVYSNLNGKKGTKTL